MLDALRDPVWQFVGAAFAVLGIFVAVYIHRLQIKRHELAIGLIYSYPLLSIADEVTSRIRVEFDGLEIKNLHLLVFGIKNSGTQAITTGDFERPISFAFSNGRVIDAHVSRQRPVSINASVVFSDAKVELQPLLLNASDQVVIQILVSANVLSPVIDLRILNISEQVSLNTREKLPPYFRSGAPYTALWLLIFALGAWFIFDNKDDAANMVAWFFGSAVASIVFSLLLRFGEEVGVGARRRIDEE